jgi:hypothetical protein
MAITEDRLRKIRTEAALFEFLRDELRWPFHDEPDTFTFSAADMGLSEEEAARIRAVRQIAPFELGQPWGIFLVEFHGAALVRKSLRRILRELSATKRKSENSLPAWHTSNLLFICTSDFHEYSFVRFDGNSHTNAVLSVFGWADHYAGLRTVCEFNLPALQYPSDPGDAAQWLTSWSSAWDVKAVTDDFYRAYNQIFKAVESEHVHGVLDENKRMFTQRLFNRLMFIHFLSKKPEGWLTFRGRKDYLNALWENRDHSANFYSVHLRPLFFTALNHPNASSIESENPVLFSLIGSVPYLNGGLFEKAADDDSGETVDNKAFDLIITGLFNRYNFTVHESTRIDIEVAVDPEMLGKVFEELVTGRHETGSYYTPRPIVSFMCKESLKGFLGGYEQLVDDHNELEIDVGQARVLLDRLNKVRVVDPACGSGAYLLGMLQELFVLNRILDTRVDELTHRDDYKRKLTIISNNIYGVDKDPFAVEIARLRLWLSLVVEYEGETPEPLPNLDFKVEQGDSVIAPSPSATVTGTEDLFRQQWIDDYAQKKSDYADPYYSGDKKALRREIGILKADIAKWAHWDANIGGFDWFVEFTEVFRPPDAAPGGFDIVLANPPYVRHEAIKQTMGNAYKTQLVTNYPDSGSGTADLYIYFYDRGLQLLKPGGMFVYISSNKWFKAQYGEKLRKHIANTTTIKSITDFGELPIFGAATFPMIFVAEKVDPAGGQMPTFTQIKSLAEPYPDVKALINKLGFELPTEAIVGDRWILVDEKTLARLRVMTKRGVPLKDFIEGKIYRGILTGMNEAFVIDGETRGRLISEDHRSAEIIKPLAVGDDVRKWTVENSDRWLIVTRVGVDISKYPAVLRHLRRNEDMLRRRQDQGEHWWELRACAYYDEFERPKILYPDIAMTPRFSYADPGHYAINTAYMIVGADAFLLCILNSRISWFWMSQMLAVIGDAATSGRLRFFTDRFQNVPIPPCGPKDRSALEQLAGEIMLRLSSDPPAEIDILEAEINERVEFLYFHQQGDETFDQWKARLAAEVGTEAGFVRTMIEGGETSAVEFKQSLEYVDPHSPGLLRVPEGEPHARKLAESQKAVVHSAMKTVCAFLNTDGGTLLVGVHDKLGAVGIAPDYALISSHKDKDPDGWERKFRSVMDTRITPRPLGHVKCSFPVIDGKTIARIQVKPTNTPSYLDGEYFIRDGNRTLELKTHERDKWIERQRTKNTDAATE